MERDYQKLEFAYRTPAEIGAVNIAHCPVVVAGGGATGLTAAIDLAKQGVHTILLDDNNMLANGSRAICFAQRTLEIFDRLGCGQRMVDKGVSWNAGRVFVQDREIYRYELRPESGYERPPFINLQQYYVEGYLTDRAAELPNLELRWLNEVIGVTQTEDAVEVEISTPDGTYRLQCDYLVAADGANSTIRRLMGLESEGQVFRDRFLIADIKMKAGFPAERWFWFDPPFHRHQSALLHRQPDDVWRLDFQLGWDADPVAERQPERVIPRVKAMLGEDVKFDIEWVSIYTFACRRMASFRHGRVLFAGDAARQVSPFGARGANSGIHDAENLAWKLRMVVDGVAPTALLDSYDAERGYAADVNILHSTRSTDFITPKNKMSRAFRDAVLSLAVDCPFARPLVNTGRLSTPSVLKDSPLNTADSDEFAGSMIPGSPAADAPLPAGAGWLLRNIGNEFTGLLFADDPPAELDQALVHTLVVPLEAGELASRYDARPGTYYLFRPDQHICARWRAFDPARVRAARDRAIGAAPSK